MPKLHGLHTSLAGGWSVPQEGNGSSHGGGECFSILHCPEAFEGDPTVVTA